MSGQDLLLDRDVRDWVLVPLTTSVVLMMVLRQYMTKYLTGPPAAADKNLDGLKEKQLVARAQILRGGGSFIPEPAFRTRKLYFVAKETGKFHQKSQAPDPREAMVTNPDVMVNMMKQNLGGMVPQFAMGAFVNYFFSGFILGKVPFPLSSRFKLMLQRGIDLPSLDVTYFTSLSYYLLLLFGMRGVFSLFFREETIDDAQMYQRQMQMQANPMATDVQKLFDTERQALELYDHRFAFEGAEQGAVDVLQRQLRGARR